MGRDRLWLRAAGGAIARRDWTGAVGVAAAAADPRLATWWLRWRRTHGPVPADGAGAARRLAAAAGVEAAEEALRRARQRAAAIGLDRADAWDAHRRAYPVPPPPARPAGTIAVLVDARGAEAAALRATLLSLIDQAEPGWRATVIAGEALAAHPVASLAASDPRIGFGGDPGGGMTALLDAGVVLDRHALGWLGFALGRTGAEAAFADEETLADDPRFGRRRSAPVLHGAFDADVASACEPPAILLLREGRGAADAVIAHGGREARRRLWIAAGTEAGAAHVPHPLAARLAPTVATRRAPPDGAEPPAPPRPLAAPASPVRPLRIVMPTRDAADLVRDAVDSLLDLAEEPAAIRLIVVDNRSAEAGTAPALAGLAAGRGIEVRRHDEPFNWSRINNLAARDGDEPALLFVNNDTRMLTRGWDRVLAAALARPATGAVGARMLYPDGTVQHAGILFGVGGAPVHEGVGAAADDPGPLGRWHATRSVAAVTGAFLAVPRAAFAEAGGFDELAMAIGHSDVDLCLGLRAAGRRVLFVPGIELVHLESRTRGANVARSRVAWDEGELASLRARWGAALDVDPGCNPRWSRHDRPFEGFRAPDEAELLDWIDRAASPDPWRIVRAGA